MGPRMREGTGGEGGNGGGLGVEGVLMGEMVARGGRGEGFPCARGNGRGSGVFHGGRVAGEGDFGQWDVGSGGRGSPPS